MGGYNDTAITDPGDVRFSGYICRAAVLPVNTSNTFDWLAAELDWATPASATKHRCPGTQRCWARCRPPARG